MKSFEVTSLRKLTFVGMNNLGTAREVYINAKLDKNAEEAYNLSNYFMRVMFHDNGKIAIFVHDNEEEETKNVKFSPKTKRELIEFAKEYLKFVVTSIEDLLG
ncbi:hypothetical protein U8V72_20880 [Priestia filamentosa]|uniref:hypothetical protein n=1 Tax=Priestia filamentosa TaxID=1402861 RepID=UPI0039792848